MRSASRLILLLLAIIGPALSGCGNVENPAYTHLERAQQLLRKHQNAKAIAEIDTAVKLSPNDAQVLNNAGYMLADADINLQQALTLTRKAARLSPNEGNIIDSLGWAHYKLGDYHSATSYLQRAVELAPNEAEIRYHLAATYAKRGLRARALIEARKALLLDSNMTTASNLLKTLHK